MSENPKKNELKTRITISLEKSLWQKIQKRAKLNGISASGFIRQMFLDEKEKR